MNLVTVPKSICEKASVLDIRALEQIGLTKKLPKKTIFRGAITLERRKAKFIAAINCDLIPSVKMTKNSNCGVVI